MCCLLCVNVCALFDVSCSLRLCLLCNVSCLFLFVVSCMLRVDWCLLLLL